MWPELDMLAERDRRDGPKTGREGRRRGRRDDRMMDGCGWHVGLVDTYRVAREKCGQIPQPAIYRSIQVEADRGDKHQLDHRGAGDFITVSDMGACSRCALDCCIVYSRSPSSLQLQVAT